MKKVALIIGGSSGIGFEVCKALKQEGYVVYNASRHPNEEEGVQHITLDVASHQVEAVIKKIYEQEHRLDALIYSAGFSMAAPIEQVRKEDWEYLFQVNLFGAIEAVKYAVPYLQEQKGSQIIFVSSIASEIPIVYDGFYSASKAALNMFAESLNLELNPKGIYVSCILPGGVKTAFTEKRKVYEVETREFQAAVSRLALLEQNGETPQEVAAKIVTMLQEATVPYRKISGRVATLFLSLKKILPKKFFMDLMAIFYGLEEEPK